MGPIPFEAVEAEKTLFQRQLTFAYQILYVKKGPFNNFHH
jgi:hypothetical protein